ncbi:M36 family metallopeptidase [Nocardioides seonyuensis]|uniref:M36 family metallopeptidase n=1 Tax=Nocardioides seonyuensis TaxID=2518371 RepID=UPI001ABDEDF2|nr:M36 family metallopeptidase [Nocardioides seonyuensis]
MITIPSARRLAPAAAGLLSLALLPGLATAPAADAGPAPATSAADLVRTLGDPVHGLADVDLRPAVTPLASQRAAVGSLGAARLRWNAQGSPASILPADGSLGPAPGAAADGARTWLATHSAVFGLTAAQVAGLELVSSQELAGSDARAVLFRQRYGDLVPATGGLVTVGVADGQVAYASSSLTRPSQAPAAPALSAVEGWLKAAADVGRATEAGDVEPLEMPDALGRWTRLQVAGLAQEQQVRLRALAVDAATVRPVWEANVVDVEGGSVLAHTVLVDAISGEVLLRRNQVDNMNDAQLFQGAITAAACGPRHTFELTDDATRSINVAALALPADDVVFKLYGPGGELLHSQDLLTSPEVASYSAEKIPAGAYGIEVCPFDEASVVVGQYALTVLVSDQAAPSGETLQANPRWRYFAANPTLDGPDETPTNSVLGCWNAEEGCDLALAQIAATGPWDTLAGGNLPTSTTLGNNASTREAWLSPLTPGGLLQAPVSPTREYTSEFTDAWNNTKCDPAQLVPGGNDIDASVGNLFASHNRMHDYSYHLGFTEKNYNMQVENGGRGGVGGDPEVGNAQAGAIGGLQTGLGRDNANQITLQDGVPGITNQYLFQPIAGAFYAPCTDGGLDMGIVGHEYTHAITNRMVGGPDDGLTSEHGGAMGESWADLVAGEYQFSHGYSNGGNIWAIGAYATGNLETAIRDYAINRNPLNFSDYGFDSTGPEVHADGEIWNGTQWEVRQALVEKYDAAFPSTDRALQLKCAQATAERSPYAPEHCPGNRRWVQLMFDSFLLQQGATSMLDARDAMIAADRMRFGGADEDLLWRAFARRGMGRDAAVTTPDDHEPTPSFASPTSANARVTFETAGQARIYVGHYEARVSPVADTVADTPLGASADFTPGTYDVVAVSPDHGFTRFTLRVEGAKARTVVVADQVNLASAAAGASVLGATSGSRNAAHLIDGTEATNWGGVTDGNVDDTTPWVAIDLAGDQHVVRRVQVSAMLNPAPADPNALPLAAAEEDPDSGSRFTALRQFALEACTSACESQDATWTRFYTSPADAFPSGLPRPVAPDLTMREFDVPDTVASAVRLVALENQCTGQAAYAGDQDDDPTNNTDCKTGSDRGTIVHAAELQVFGAAAGAPPVTAGPGAGPSTTPGTTPGTTTGTTPGTTPGTTTGTEEAARTETSLRMRIKRARQTPRNRAPQLRLAVRPSAEEVAGTFVVRVDGRRWRKVTTDDGRARILLTKRLRPGQHVVRVRFRPDDRAAYTGSRSRARRVVVRGRR